MIVIASATCAQVGRTDGRNDAALEAMLEGASL
jgi:hypothetical protein